MLKGLLPQRAVTLMMLQTKRAAWLAVGVVLTVPGIVSPARATAWERTHAAPAASANADGLVLWSFSQPDGEDPSNGPWLLPETCPLPSPDQVTTTPTNGAAAVAPSPAGTAAVTNRAGWLDAVRCDALGMIESGNDDSAIGGAGEVSRFQIMPSVWQRYSASRAYSDPAQARRVAQRHWTALYQYFKAEAHREPGDFDMYVLWNTRFGYYERKGFDPLRLAAVVRDRANRFTNLVEEGERRESTLALAGTRD
jgi:hypothetical protein